MNPWDVVVIGGGAAGLTAAALAARSGATCLLLDRLGGGGELMNLTAPLHDMAETITGPDLAARLLEGALGAGVELGIEDVTALAQSPSGWSVKTTEGAHAARAVILAIGLAPGRLDVPDEERFEGRGLSHCAACDGPLYRGQPIIVAGADRWAVQEALDLVPLAASVTLVTQGAAAFTVPGVTVLEGEVTALEGGSGLEAVIVQGAGSTRRLAARAVFVQAGRRPALGFAPPGLAQDAEGRLLVDASLRCGSPALLAIGEARSGFPSSLAAAIQDGRRAAAMIGPA
jgi:thioredoxin reductase (NADPH)